MAFIPTYPSVVVREIDQSTTVTTSGTSTLAAFAGNFQDGPTNIPTLILTENDIVEIFGKPTTDNYKDFLLASQFTKYASGLYITRCVDATAMNASSGNTNIQVGSDEEYENANLSGTGEFISQYPGVLGNSLFVAWIDSQGSFSSNVNPTSNTFGVWSSYFNTLPGTSDVADLKGGSNDELHLLVIDEDGAYTGYPGTILEKYAYLSKATDATKDGLNNYYKDVINTQSKYIRCGDTYLLDANSTCVVSDTFVGSGSDGVSLTGGVAVSTSNTAMYSNAYDTFADDKNYLISHIIAGDVSSSVLQEIIVMAETRQDCVVYYSPRWSDVQPGQTQSEIASNCVDYKNTTIAYPSSYAICDGNWKLTKNKYTGVDNWIPCCADSAGLKAQAEISNEIWYNGAGLRRGLIKNCIKLAWNPRSEYEGILYSNSINPIVQMNGATVLLGDKTSQLRPSAFDRQNVRYLFNHLKKVIKNFLIYYLFEFNDGFTRTSIKTHIDSFLTEIKGRGGVYDFLVVCDKNNNTPEVIDSNQLIVDVYLKPTKTASWIILNMVAVSTGVSFTEKFA